MAENAFIDHDDVVESRDVGAFWSLLRYVGKDTRLFWSAAGVLTIASGATVGAAWLWGKLIEDGFNARDKQTIVVFGTAVIVFELLAVGLRYGSRVIIALVASRSILRIRLALVEKLGHLPMRYYDHQPLGRTVTRLTSDVEGVEGFFSRTLATILMTVNLLAVTVVAMLITDVRLGVIAIIGILPAIAITLSLKQPIRQLNRRYAQKNSAINAQLSEFLNGLPVVRILGAEGWARKRFEAIIEEFRAAAMALNGINAWVRPLINGLCMLPLVLVLFIGGSDLQQGVISLALLVTFIRYTQSFAMPIIMISREIHQIQQAFSSLERIRRLLDEDDENKVLGQNGQRSAASCEGQIRFDDVWMAYEEENWVLKGLSFNIEAGSVVGVVGTTGSGKTSTLTLLSRLYPFQKGTITLDGCDIGDYDRESLRQAIGFVSQDVVIFDGTLRDNLVCSARGGDALQHACELTGLAQVMQRNNWDFDFKVLAKGENLSVGERQLVSLTRVLLSDPKILVLDEATANIDPATEAIIQNGIWKVMQGRTCIIIAHRLETLARCQTLFVYRDGRIIERGNHGELLATDGYYRRLQSQSKQ